MSSDAGSDGNSASFDVEAAIALEEQQQYEEDAAARASGGGGSDGNASPPWGLEYEAREEEEAQYVRGAPGPSTARGGMSLARAQELEQQMEERMARLGSQAARGAPRVDEDEQEVVELISFILQRGAGQGVDAATRPVTQQTVTGAFPDMRSDTHCLKWRLDACNKLRRVLGALLDAIGEHELDHLDVAAPEWPRLTHAQLFPNQHADRWRDFVNERRKLWNTFAQRSALNARYGRVWAEYDRQTRVALRGAGAPPIERHTSGLAYDERACVPTRRVAPAASLHGQARRRGRAEAGAHRRQRHGVDLHRAGGARTGAQHREAARRARGLHEHGHGHGRRSGPGALSRPLLARASRRRRPPG